MALLVHVTILVVTSVGGVVAIIAGRGRRSAAGAAGGAGAPDVAAKAEASGPVEAPGIDGPPA